MSSALHSITFDCTDAYTLARFWSEVTGWPMGADDVPGDPEAAVIPPAGTGGPRLLFIAVPEPKAVKNRVHLDLQPQDRTREEEVQRLLAVGATLVEDLRNPDGTGWAVLADPEGNELCVERSAAERAATA
ncbi:putative enzyme related to lactoylglutathione lyase [Kitasatospora sp. MAA4]|uniref:VOC family protein n=1 Tax=Kitasatospora sp. MAA4 TaxID=3035093 RepID=UPI002474F8DB|nr:VOC family protein [Kitasatospora sp. MAA4]MDH6137652.1 putative enzyme related to lactoylglutathione lyase [Kitasatospora sp. MAA4]